MFKLQYINENNDGKYQRENHSMETEKVEISSNHFNPQERHEGHFALGSGGQGQSPV